MSAQQQHSLGPPLNTTSNTTQHHPSMHHLPWRCRFTNAPYLPPPQAVFLLIGKTSALTMNIAGVIKDWMLIFASYALFGAPVTRLNLAGYVFCCAGVVVYNRLKLVALTARLAGEGSSSGTTGGRDLEAPLLVQRSKADILADIGRLRAELDAADGGRRGTSSSTGSMHIGLSTPQRLTGLQSQGAQLMSRSGGSGSGGSSVGNSPSLAAGRHA